MHALVLIYADWCPYCTIMMPEWDTLERSRPEFEMIAIESKDMRNPAFDPYVSAIDRHISFPTIAAVDPRTRQYIPFERERTAKNMSAFMQSIAHTAKPKRAVAATPAKPKRAAAATPAKPKRVAAAPAKPKRAAAATPAKPKKAATATPAKPKRAATATPAKPKRAAATKKQTQKN